MHYSQIIVITGAGSGFGRVTAIALARAGHTVYASMRDLDGHSQDKADGLRLLAQTMALENSRYGIESVIVMSGAYTSGTDHCKHAVAAADVAVSAQYGRMAPLAQQLAAKLDAANVPGVRTDADEVAEAIRDVIALPHGTRPARLEVDPQRRGALDVYTFAQQQRAAFFGRLGIDDLLHTPLQ